MKQGNIKRWSNVDSCKNLLLFTELINELLFDYSIPSNRISTLNSHFLCIDAMNAIEGIDYSGVPEGTLKPIVEELYSSLSKDVLFSRKKEKPLKYFIKYQAKNQKYQPISRADDLDFDESKKIVRTINQRYFKDHWYLESLKSEIADIVIRNDKNDWLDLFRLTKIFLTELVNSGYSARYIMVQTLRMFHGYRAIDKPNAISDYMKLFDCKEIKFYVIAKIKSEYRKLFQTNKNVEFKSDLSPRTKVKKENEFLHRKENESFAVFTINALDPFSAVEICKGFLDTNAALYRMYNHDFSFEMNTVEWAAYDENDWFTCAGQEKSPVQRTKMPNKIKLEERLQNALLAVLTSFKKGEIDDVIAINNALQFHSLSLDSKSNQNQLLDLWAIFETLLDISNKHTSDRIQQVCKYLVPILKRKYIFSLFHQLAYDIKNYSEEWYNTITEGAVDEDEIVYKVCDFVLLSNRESKRDEFLAQCNEYPLLLERVQYYIDALSTPQKIYAFVEKHSERVRWQIMRIYRNRNLIIHNARSMPYLNLLVENLHSYIDDFLEYTIQSMADGHTLESMCQELYAQECEWIEDFQSGRNKVLDDDIIRKVLQM